jgi:recombination protein RecT
MSTENTNTPAAQQTTSVQRFQEKTVDNILSRINDFLATGDIVLPPNYIPENAVRAGWLMLQDVVDREKRPALEVCTKESIANAFLEMVIKGLSVVKKQAYFVVYGNELSLDESYFGAVSIAKRDAGVKEPKAVIIYKDDIFRYEILENGRKRVIEHQQEFKNIDNDKIVGAYSVVTYNDGSTDTEIMTLAQIKKSWEMGGSKGISPAHKNFPDQMCAKTVITRSLKVAANTSDDSALMREDDQVSAGVKHEIKEKAHKKNITFDDAEIMEDPKKVEPAKTEVKTEPAAAAAENTTSNELKF